jgi:hypothetical protein
MAHSEKMESGKMEGVERWKVWKDGRCGKMEGERLRRWEGVERWKVGKDGRWDVGKFGRWGKLKGN